MLKARPTTYCGVEMRSRLEARFAAWLDGRGFAWDYEPRCFANAGGQYLPDFLITYAAMEHFIEVKPANANGETPDRLNEFLRQGAIIRDSRPGAVYFVVWPDDVLGGLPIEAHPSQLVRETYQEAGFTHFPEWWAATDRGELPNGHRFISDAPFRLEHYFGPTI